MKRHFTSTALAAALALPGLVHADPDTRRVEELHQTTLELIELLVAQGTLTREAADGMLAKARARAAEKTAQAAELDKKTVRVGYVPEQVKREIAESVRTDVVAQAKLERWGDVNSVPEWLDRIKLEGDIRLRHQGDFFAAGNAPEAAFQAIGQNVSNSLEDRQRERVRLRLAINANVTGKVDAGIRLASGSASDPVSTNQTLGNTSQKYAFSIDRAFLRIQPVDDLTLWGGRMPNPFFGGDLVWDDDLNFEGAAASYAPGADEPGREWKPFVTGGVFPLQEVEKSAANRVDDKWLFALQAGTEWSPSTRARFKLGVGYYHYENLAGRSNPALGNSFYNASAPQSRQKGNSLFNIDNDGDPATHLWALLADYRVAHFTLVADFAEYFPVHLIGSFDFAKNLGFDAADIVRRSGQTVAEESDAYQARLTVGYPKITEAHEWQASVGYRYLERDAVLDAYTDSDFHLGGTNHKGWFVGGAYGLYKNTWLSGRWLSSDAISGLPLAIDVLQVDLNAKF